MALRVDKVVDGNVVFHDHPADDIPLTDTNDHYDATEVEGALEELGEIKDWENGFDTQTDLSMPDLAFDTGTRTFSCSVKGGASNFYFWAKGKKIIKTTTQSVIIPDATDTYYTYFDNDGVLQYVELASVTSIVFYQYAIAGIIYWNATAGTAMVGKELHGVRMDARTHHYNHNTFGARYEDGMNIDGLSDGGITYTQTTSGHFWDEDVRHTISAMATAPFIYRLGADGEWTGTTPDNEVGYLEGGDTYYSWNEWTGSTWQLTEGGVLTDYFITFFISTPDISGYPIKKIIGHNAYPNVTAARNAIESEQSTLQLEGLPSPEFVFLYAVIVKRNGQLQALADGSLFLDLRTSKGGAGGSSGISSLAGDVGTDVTNFDTHLSSADTDVQKALDTLDDHDHTASQISDFDTEVSNNTDVTANTTHSGSDGKDHSDVVTNNAKVTNATHTGEVTGSTALTIANNIVDEANMKISNAPTNDDVLTADSAATGGWKWAEAGASAGGWLSADETWTYTGADDPSFTFRVTGNVTSKYSLGMRIKLTQTTVKYFIITKISYSSPYTTFTVYGGTDYNLTSATISANSYSVSKAPQGFPMDPKKWEVFLEDSTSYDTISPTNTQVYNSGSLYIDVPIGVWYTGFSQHVRGRITYGSALALGLTGGLSTSASSESDNDFKSTLTTVAPAVTGGLFGLPMYQEKILTLTVKDRYYLTQRMNFGGTLVNLYLRGDINTTKIYARCAYL